MKTCSKCGKSKDESEFNRAASKRDGLRPECKACQAEDSRRWYEANRDRKAERVHLWRAANREAVQKYNRRWREANRERKAEYERQRRANDPQYKIASNLRSRGYNAVRAALNGGKAAGSFVRDLGISMDEFLYYISTKFVKDMNWDNYGEWCLDHVKPLVSFDLTDREQFLRAAHYSNYQPMWCDANVSKGARFVDAASPFPQNTQLSMFELLQ